jgi:hypothetical protein
VDDGWGWMLRWLFGPTGSRTPRRDAGEARIYLAPF